MCPNLLKAITPKKITINPIKANAISVVTNSAALNSISLFPPEGIGCPVAGSISGVTSFPSPSGWSVIISSVCPSCISSLPFARFPANVLSTCANGLKSSVVSTGVKNSAGVSFNSFSVSSAVIYFIFCLLKRYSNCCILKIRSSVDI